MVDMLIDHAEVARERTERQTSAVRTVARQAALELLGPLHPGSEGEALAEQVAVGTA